MVRLQQTVTEEGLEREWRWKEGGSDEKIYTGRHYPWRKYALEFRLRDGRTVRGRVAAGFPLDISGARIDSDTVTPPEAECLATRFPGQIKFPSEGKALDLRMIQRKAEVVDRLRTPPSPLRFRERDGRAVVFGTLVLSPKNKGRLGENLYDMLYVREIDFRSPAEREAEPSGGGREK